MVKTQTITQGKEIIRHLKVAMDQQDKTGIALAKLNGRRHAWIKETDEVQKTWNELIHTRLADELEQAIDLGVKPYIHDAIDALDRQPKDGWNKLPERLRTRVQNLMEWAEEKLLGHES